MYLCFAGHLRWLRDNGGKVERNLTQSQSYHPAAMMETLCLILEMFSFFCVTAITLLVCTKNC